MKPLKVSSHLPRNPKFRVQRETSELVMLLKFICDRPERMA